MATMEEEITKLKRTIEDYEDQLKHASGDDRKQLMDLLIWCRKNLSELNPSKSYERKGI